MDLSCKCYYFLNGFSYNSAHVRVFFLSFSRMCVVSFVYVCLRHVFMCTYTEMRALVREHLCYEMTHLPVRTIAYRLTTKNERTHFLPLYWRELGSFITSFQRLEKNLIVTNDHERNVKSKSFDNPS